MYIIYDATLIILSNLGKLVEIIYIQNCQDVT